MALIIPYRDREEHLQTFLQIFPPRLKTLCPQIEYAIFVIEQKNEKSFNRGKLLNVGFSLLKDQFDYFCFHDVDMLPTYADYSYPSIPTHLAADVSQFRQWKGKGLAYSNYFGGVVLFNKKDFITINGYSNHYWGYGIEDDDLLVRVVEHGLKWTRRPGVYESLFHPPTGGTLEHKANKARFLSILKGQEADSSGLSDLEFIVKDEKIFETHKLYQVDI
ncbi:galactosyltransferase-related protein [Candidatus Protochlamydia phocaeensis]|uniref:galactosyltransferase-related protein n=1 Tax=Candidatus Protochlamydia phocaeensis TaxID=1414722 RepID=UPI0018968E63|nr:galactosyltransferase-related protein [Candidatus Protochlamydia phocaeensis]